VNTVLEGNLDLICRMVNYILQYEEGDVYTLQVNKSIIIFITNKMLFHHWLTMSSCTFDPENKP
jgi:hypothetical protein